MTVFEVQKKCDFIESPEEVDFMGYKDFLILYLHHHHILMWKDIVMTKHKVGLDIKK